MKRGSWLYPALRIGETVSLASEIYSSVEEDQTALLVEINNYCEWTLDNAEYRIYAGRAYNRPSSISAGHTEAFSIIDDLKGSITGSVTWKLTNDHYCHFYFYIHSALKRWVDYQGNSIGIGCSNNSAYQFELITSQRFDGTSDNILQHCSTDICIQIDAGASHQTRTTVDVIPKCVSHVAHNIEGDISQSDLDTMISDESDSNLG